ncbi:hypothetical protein K431DRAFT_170612 [Polychaeton citri CBS 116435]|uniref:SWIM-type domain-containing protein n=1 Tax=Polychaeton citri CBS 116435 TaxID=1314669 RepID=A0A9P4UKI2_9PEZI|nr:hypothetical protein K431DRAFT_170612 [Polychaeton citri CBS 116435]
MDDPDPLPSSKAVSAAVIHSIRDCTIGSAPDAALTASSNPLLHADVRTRHHFLTLHALFPQELLPALDVLDRNLVLRLVPKPAIEPERAIEASAEGAIGQPNASLNVSETSTMSGETLDKDSLRIFYVRSAQQRTHNRSSASKHKAAVLEMDRHYEVRLDAWTCSCPAFSFSAFPPHIEDTTVRTQHDDEQLSAHARNVHPFAFGGLAVTQHTPMCKHLLACLLASQVEAFKHFIDDKDVSLEEFTAWTAGWGD